MMFRIHWRYGSFSPLERSSVLVVGGNKFVNGLAYLVGRSETCSVDHLAGKDAEPYLHLVEPRGMRRGIVKMDVRVAGQPAVMFGLMGVKVIQHDMYFFVQTGSHHFIHEVKELTSPAAGIVAGAHHTGSYIQSSKQGSDAMALILMTEPAQCLAIGEAQPALGSLQSLNGGLLVNTKHYRILGRVEVQSNDIGRFRSKFWVGAYAPVPPTLQMNTMAAEYSPDLVIRNIPQSSSQELSCPATMPSRRRIIQLSQNALLCLHAILWPASPPGGIRQAGYPLLKKSGAPFAYRGRTQPQVKGDLLGHLSRRCFQYDAGPWHKALLRGSFASPRFQLLALFLRQGNYSCFSCHEDSIHHNAYYCN